TEDEIKAKFNELKDKLKAKYGKDDEDVTKRGMKKKYKISSMPKDELKAKLKALKEKFNITSDMVRLQHRAFLYKCS
ncbi:hypothetical protein PoB_007173000, partial [Plakobranchus ocellatus]